MVNTVKKIASEMTVPHSQGKYYSKRDKLEVKQHTDRDTFRAV